MPRGDGTGPMGVGPMTGRGAGYCAGFEAPGFGCNRGYGNGMGFGRGRRNFGYPAQQMQRSAPLPVDVSNELLQRQAEALQNQLDAIKKRLDEKA